MGHYNNYFIFQRLYKFLRLYTPNHGKVITLKSEDLSIQGIEVSVICLAPELIHIYSGKLGITFDNSVLV